MEVSNACRQLTPSPHLIDSDEIKPTPIRKSTLDCLPDVFRKAAYILAERGEIEIIEHGAPIPRRAHHQTASKIKSSF